MLSQVSSVNSQAAAAAAAAAFDVPHQQAAASAAAAPQEAAKKSQEDERQKISRLFFGKYLGEMKKPTDPAVLNKAVAQLKDLFNDENIDPKEMSENCSLILIACKFTDFETIGELLGSDCTVAMIPKVMKCFKEVPSVAMFTNSYSLLKGFLSTLIKSDDADKIKASFSVYWTIHKTIYYCGPGLTWKLMPLIKTETALAAIKAAIPDVEDQTDDISIYFRTEKKYYNCGTDEYYRLGHYREYKHVAPIGRF